MYKYRVLGHCTLVDLQTFQHAFAKRLRALREERGMRQEDFEEYGISWKTIQNIEYATTDLKVSTLLKLADALQLSLSELVTLDEPKG